MKKIKANVTSLYMYSFLSNWNGSKIYLISFSKFQILFPPSPLTTKKNKFQALNKEREKKIIVCILIPRTNLNL
jgi:hypothetical protein